MNFYTKIKGFTQQQKECLAFFLWTHAGIVRVPHVFGEASLSGQSHLEYLDLTST